MIVADRPLLREAIKPVVESHFPSPVVRETAAEESAIRIVRAESVEMAMLDIGLRDSSGVTVLKRIKLLRPSLKCLVLTMHDHAHTRDSRGAMGVPVNPPKERLPVNCPTPCGPSCSDVG